MRTRNCCMNLVTQRPAVDNQFSSMKGGKTKQKRENKRRRHNGYIECPGKSVMRKKGMELECHNFYFSLSVDVNKNMMIHENEERIDGKCRNNEFHARQRQEGVVYTYTRGFKDRMLSQ